MTTTATALPEGKTDFVKNVLANNARANTKAVNEAWAAAGRSGQISSTLVNKLRSSLGYAGNLRSHSKKEAAPTPPAKAPYTGKKRGRKPKQAVNSTGVLVLPHLNGARTDETKAGLPSRGRLNADFKALEELEAEFDRPLSGSEDRHHTAIGRDMLERTHSNQARSASNCERASYTGAPYCRPCQSDTW
jgi:hypothetical protein